MSGRRLGTVLTAAALALAAPAPAQTADCPSAALGYTVLSSTDFPPPPGAEVATRESRIAACLIAVAGEPLRVALGMDYVYTRHEYDGVAGRDRDLHRLQLPLAFAWRGEGFGVDAFVAPGLATSSNVFKDPGSRAGGEDFLFAGRLEARLQRGEHSAWLLGVTHDRSLGESRTLPVAGLEIRPADAVRLRLAWPDPALAVEFSSRQSLLFDVFPAGQRWHVVSDELDAEFDYRLEAWRVQVTWSYRVTRAFTVDVGVGGEFGREHGYTDDTGTRFDVDADPGPLVAIGFRLGGSELPRGRGPSVPRFGASTGAAAPGTLVP